MKLSDYIVIQGYMVSQLGLSGNRLIVYAIIRGFSKDGVHEFKGSLNYLSDWTNLSKKTIIETLKSLVNDNLIEKREYIENNVKFCAYKAVGGEETTPLVKKLYWGGEDSTLGGGEDSTPNSNNIDNDKDNKEDTNVSNIEGSRLSFKDKVLAYFNEKMKDKSIKPIRLIENDRLKLLQARIRQYGEDAIFEAIDKAAESSFLNGCNNRGFVATFDWIMKPNNFPKVLEGNYENRRQTAQATYNTPIGMILQENRDQDIAESKKDLWQ